MSHHLPPLLHRLSMPLSSSSTTLLYVPMCPSCSPLSSPHSRVQGVSLPQPPACSSPPSSPVRCCLLTVTCVGVLFLLFCIYCYLLVACCCCHKRGVSAPCSCTALVDPLHVGAIDASSPSHARASLHRPLPLPCCPHSLFDPVPLRVRSKC